MGERDSNSDMNEEFFDPELVTQVRGQKVLEIDSSPDAYSWIAITNILTGKVEALEKGNWIELLLSLPGVYLIAPHAEWIAISRKKLIAKLKPLPDNYLDRPVYIVDSEKVWAKVRIGDSSLVSLDEFDARFSEHRVSVGERGDWWSDAENLRLYPVEILESYADEPKEYRYPHGAQAAIREVGVI